LAITQQGSKKSVRAINHSKAQSVPNNLVLLDFMISNFASFLSYGQKNGPDNDQIFWNQICAFRILFFDHRIVKKNEDIKNPGILSGKQWE
jgi:hypothetical protein